MSNLGTAGFKNFYKIEHYRAGELLHEETVKNLVVNEGLNDVLSVYFKGSSYTARHYLGLRTAGAILPGDTLSGLGAGSLSWGDFIKYMGDRQIIVLGAVASQKVNNENSRAQFIISGVTNPSGDVVSGLYVTNQLRKNSHSGVLYGAVDFAAPRTVLNDDVLVVTVEFSMSSL